MNIHRSIALTLAFLAGPGLAAAPVTEEKSWRETYPVGTPVPTLEISNIWGSVRVRSGEPGRIIVAVTESRSAPNRELFERSLERIRLDVRADANGLSMRVGDRDERWHHLDDCHGCRVDYQFDVQVPPGTALDVGTVLDGIVDVQGVAGIVSASNVNGPVSIAGIRDCESIESVNGKVSLGYSRAPTEDCRIDTINGDVTIDVPDGSNVDFAVDLFNGDIRSEFPAEPFSLPATIEQVVDEGRSQYRIQQLAGIRIGAGGPVYTVTSMNGDLHIGKQP